MFIIQPTSNPVNEHLMELLIMIDACKRASAANINIVMPYYGYARQDRKARAREPITAKLVANMLEVAGVDRLLTIDLHAAQIQGFFDIPVDHLMGAPLIADYFERRGMVGSDYVVVSPDHGGVTRARKLAEFLKTSIAIIDKRRSVDKMNTSEVMNIIGKVEGKTCILIDDMIDTAGTLCKAADILIEKGAKRFAFVGGDYSKKAQEDVLEGLKEVLSENQLTLDEQLIFNGNETYKDGLRAFDALKSSKPDAILSISDEQAIGLVHAAQDEGVTVPDDLQIVSFNNTRLVEMVRPQLSSVIQPLYDIGAVGMRLLTKYMNEEEIDEPNVILPYRVEYRGTTK
mgnify:CR=1 FL=1